MSRDPQEMINAYGLMTATGLRYAEPITGRGTGWAWGSAEFWGPDAWEAMTKAAGIERWVTPTEIGGWWPAEIIDKAKTLGLHRQEGRKIGWREGRPCEETVSTEWGSHRCERPVAGTTDRGLPVCSLHLKVHERAVERQRGWREAWDAEREMEARQAEHRRLAEELLDWAGDLLAELGIHPATVTVGSIGERTGLLLPAEAVATLIEEATGERYPGRAAALSTPNPTTRGGA